MANPAILALLLLSFGRPIDTYARQPLDVEHYHFAVELSDTTDRIVGSAAIRMRMLSAGVRTVTLDLANATAERKRNGMIVSNVSRAGRALQFVHSDDHLVISLDSASALGGEIELVVRYSGVPADGLQIKPNKYSERTFFSDNWPNKAHNWLPLIDHISDKATMEMDVTAPSDLQVVSNGLRVEMTDLPRGMRRTVWRESIPIAPRLYALGAAHFAVQRLADYDGIPLETWVFAQDRDAGFYDYAVPTRDVLAFYSTAIGPYSYEKLANVQSNSVSGGMEAASAIFYSSGSVQGNRPLRWRNVIVHEIAHQWFGNAVTEADWNDVWLSEGFATYFTLLFIEHAYGRDEFAQGLRDSRKTIIDFDAKSPNYRVVHENLADMSQVTSAMTYQKGSWVLHMLRQSMGDDRFWTGIRDYYARHRNANATTTDFRHAMERAAGRDLSEFFQQWLYRGGIPHLNAMWEWDALNKRVEIDVRQVQAGTPFNTSVEFGITEDGKQRIVAGSMVGASTHFSFSAAKEPETVELDPNVRLLMTGQLLRQ
ncbi:MAG: M1 family metallopeptidase [Gemmatimonadaceae bacterium]